jgi:hypothetical protein
MESKLYISSHVPVYCMRVVFLRNSDNFDLGFTYGLFWADSSKITFAVQLLEKIPLVRNVM